MPRDSTPPRLCIMMCVRDEADAILDHLLYHHRLGASRAYVFLDDCRDGTAEVLAALPWVTAIDRPREAGLRHFTPHQVACARAALELARRDGCEWLLHIDPDEFAWGDNPPTGDPARDGSLLELIRRARPETELIALGTREVIPVRGEENEPAWRQEYFQAVPHVFERDMLDPTSGEMRRLAKWIGHNLGKSIVRTAADVEPVNAHAWRRAAGSGGGDLVTERLGFHYHFVVGGARSWRAKYRKLAWEHSVWAEGPAVPFPKQAWKEASLAFDESQAADYYDRWIAVSRDEAEALVRAGKASRERNVQSVMDAVEGSSARSARAASRPRSA